MSDNYPPGAASDKNAPYNQGPDWEPKLCKSCNGEYVLNEEGECEACFYNEGEDDVD